jgi:nitrogenase molybdenum-iron protein beta chain
VVSVSTRTHLPLTPTFLDGLLLLANAVPDTSLVIDCANCGSDKFAMVGAQHDTMSSLSRGDRNLRVRYSDLKANDMIMGTERRVRQTVIDLMGSHHPSLVFLVQSSAVQLIGTDVVRLADDLESELKLPIAVVPPQPLSGDFLDGFASALEALARKMPLSETETSPGRLGLVGNLFERFEADAVANVGELRRLIEGLGFEPGAVWLDGRDTRGLADVARDGTLLAFPEGARAATALAARTGAKVIEARVPVGLDGTVRFLEEVGERLGAADRVKPLVARELEVVVPRLEKAVHRSFLHRCVAVVAPPAEAVSLASYLDELGMVVKLVVVLARRDAAAKLVGETLAAAGMGAEIVPDPSFPLVEEAFRGLREAGSLDLVVGSGAARDAAKAQGIPYVEFMHPCYVRHALFDAPWVGFRGALWLADAMFNRLHDDDYSSY